MNLKQLLTTTPELQVLLSVPEPDYVGVAAFINNVPMVPNPIDTPPQVIKFPTIEELFLEVPPAEGFRIQSAGELINNVKEAIDTRNFASLVYGFLMIESQKVELNISDSTIAKLKTLLGTYNEETQWFTPDTIPDPNYQALVPDPNGSLAQQNGLSGVDAGQVMLAWVS